MKNIGVEPPFVVSVLCEPAADSMHRGFQQSCEEGAGMVEINLAQLSSLELEALAGLDWSGPAPCYTACRRREFMQVYGYPPSALHALSDAERVDRELRQLDWAVGMDVELDLFWSAGPSAIADFDAHIVGDVESARRRNELIGELHRRDKLAIVSCHTGQAMDPPATEALAAYIQDCGADACKIIHTHQDVAFIPEVLTSILRLRRKLSIPFVLLSIGPGSLLARYIANQAGCSYSFGRPSGVTHFFSGHPPLTTLRSLAAMLPTSQFWRDLDAVKMESR